MDRPGQRHSTSRLQRRAHAPSLGTVMGEGLLEDRKDADKGTPASLSMTVALVRNRVRRDLTEGWGERQLADTPGVSNCGREGSYGEVVLMGQNHLESSVVAEAGCSAGEMDPEREGYGTVTSRSAGAAVLPWSWGGGELERARR